MVSRVRRAPVAQVVAIVDRGVKTGKARYKYKVKAANGKHARGAVIASRAKLVAKGREIVKVVSHVQVLPGIVAASVPELDKELGRARAKARAAAIWLRFRAREIRCVIVISRAMNVRPLFMTRMATSMAM